MSFKIPKRFQLGGQTFRVKMLDKEVQPGVAGQCNFDKTHVKISRKTSYGDVSPDAQARNFCHELVHLIFFAIGEPRLTNNELLVERCGVMLYQALKTMR